MNLPVCRLGVVWNLAAISTILLVTSSTTLAQRSAPSRPAVPRQGHSATRVSGTNRATTRTVATPERLARSSVRVLDEPKAADPETTPGLPPEVIFEGEGEPWIGEETCGCSGPCGHHGGCLIPCPDLCFRNLDIVIGTQGFTGPSNRGETASFGFHEGVNWGAPIPCFGCGELGMQFGMRTAQSNLSGSEYTQNERHQVFVTGGLFRRVDWGFQGGIVVDYLHEDWYYEADLIQLRGELSWLYPGNHEIGCWFTSSTQTEDIESLVLVDDVETTVNEALNPTDLYAFFYRHRLDDCSATSGRMYAGFTGKGDGLLGADLQLPFNDCWAFQSGVTYLIPKESTGETGHVEESWNFGMSMVWRPGGGFLSQNYYRPLFNVADNGSFMVDRR